MTTERPLDFERYAGELRSLARDLLADDWLAEDVVQEVWLASQRNAPALPQARRAWLRGIAWNVSQSMRRDRARRQVRERRASRSEVVDSDPSRPLEREAMRRQLTDAITALDEPYAETLRSFYLKGETAAVIAGRLECPLPTVRTHLQRGLQRLRVELDRKVGGQRAMALGLVDLFRWSPRELAAGGLRQVGWWSRGVAALGAGVPAIALFLAFVTVAGVVLRMAWKPKAQPEAEAQLVTASVPSSAEVGSMGMVPTAPDVARNSPDGGALAGEPQREPSVAAETNGASSSGAAAWTLHVVDDLGAPMPGARLWEGPLDSMTPSGFADDAGAFQPDPTQWTLQPVQLAVGMFSGYFVRASAAGFADSRIYYVVPEEFDGSDLVLRLLGPGTAVEGVVRDGAGKPLVGATVRQVRRTETREWQPGFGIVKQDLQVLSDADGRFRLQGSQAVHTLVVSAPGHAPSWIAVDGRQRTQVACEVELTEGYSVAGKLLDPQGEPLAGTPLTVRWPSRSFLEPVEAISDVAGRFEFDNLPPGAARVSAVSEELHIDHEWELGEGKSIETTLSLSPVASVMVRLVDLQQKPISGYRVDLMTPKGEWTRFFNITDEEGMFRTDSWPELPVRAVVRASTDQVPLYAQVLDPPAANGVTIECARHFESSGNLRGSVDLSWLERPTEAVVLLSHLSARTNVYPKALRGGSFYFAGLPPARYDLLLVANPHGRWKLADLELNGDDTDLGSLAIPPMGQLELEWNVPGVENTFFRIRQLQADGSGRRGFYSLAEGRGAPATHWTLLPGTYVAIANTAEGEIVVARFVTVQPGMTSRLHVDPSGPLVATFEIRAPEGSLGSQTVDLYRLEDEEDMPENMDRWASSRLPALQVETQSGWDGKLRGSFTVDDPGQWVAGLQSADGSTVFRTFERDADYEIWHLRWDVEAEELQQPQR